MAASLEPREQRLIKIDPAIEANFQKVLEDHTAGDPMRLEVKWTNLSRRQIAKRMEGLGTPVSRDVVSQWLRAPTGKSPPYYHDRATGFTVNGDRPRTD